MVHELQGYWVFGALKRAYFRTFWGRRKGKVSKSSERYQMCKFPKEKSKMRVEQSRVIFRIGSKKCNLLTGQQSQTLEEA